MSLTTYCRKPVIVAGIRAHPGCLTRSRESFSEKEKSRRRRYGLFILLFRCCCNLRYHTEHRIALFSQIVRNWVKKIFIIKLLVQFKNGILVFWKLPEVGQT